MSDNTASHHHQPLNAEDLVSDQNSIVENRQIIIKCDEVCQLVQFEQMFRLGIRS